MSLPPTPLRRIAPAFCLALGALAAGCGTPPAPAADPGRYVGLPMGAVTVYHRVSSGSYGQLDGDVTWTHAERDWNGRRLTAAASPQAGTNLLDPASHGLVTMLNTAGQPALSFEPPVGLRFPLAVGQEWTAQHTMTVHASQQQRPYVAHYRVEAREPVSVPAGTFETFRVASVDNYGETTMQWAAPDLGLVIVKRILDRPASHPQGVGHLEGELVAVQRPR